MKRRLVGALLTVYGLSALFFTAVLPSEATSQNILSGKSSFSATDLGVLCISTVYPGVMNGLDSRDNEEIVAEVEEAPKVTEEEPEPNVDVFGEDPLVLIVHTHATETYLPSTAGNYHSKEKTNSVREVGQVLAESLEKEGISVIHDETLHDNPSYNNSYSRSYETIRQLLEQYPTIQCVIDLHRDAISSEATGDTISINGKSRARYMYVVSTEVDTATENRSFVEKLNRIAEEEFYGFSGSVLERGYKYNQDLSEKYLLLEFGNNRNHIEEVRNTAELYGKILAKALKEEAKKE